MRIHIEDQLPPEDVAMLQALQSRSPATVAERLDKVRAVGSGEFMDQYYVGYGHASIGDCGTTTIFIEDVTMLEAKAIQDWPLYSGQESSTRYMDFSTVPFSNPCGLPQGEQIQQRWRHFYLTAQPILQQHLREQYPRRHGEQEKIWERAIKARAFDVLRGFLPAGAHTQLSWQTNLRQAADHLAWLVNHPRIATRELAVRLVEDLRAKYPHSFRPIEPTPWRQWYMRHLHHVQPYDVEHDDDVIVTTPMVQAHFDPAVLMHLEHRPRSEPVPWTFAELGQIVSEFTLDFGSYRDLQRHRNGTIRMPLLTMANGFHHWYMQQLPRALREEANALLEAQRQQIEDLPGDPFEKQDYIAMGYRVVCRVTQSLPAFMYRLELRSGKTIHPTLRAVILAEIEQFYQRFPRVVLHVDTDPDDWTVRRGAQTIEEKQRG